jgi:hypothetical protein
VLGAQVDDIAVLTVQCNAQRLFLAMTGSRKRKILQASLAVYFFYFLFYTKSTQRGDRGE